MIPGNIGADKEARLNLFHRPYHRALGQMAEVEMVREVRRGERLQGCAVTTAALIMLQPGLLYLYRLVATIARPGARLSS